MTQASITQQIEHHEQQLQSAMLNSDITQLDQLLSDDLVFISHLGQPMGKQDDLGAHQAGMVEIDSLELAALSIQGSDTLANVSVKARIAGRFGGQPSEGTFWFSRVWRKRPESDQWQVVFAQSTLANDTAASS